MKTTKMLLVSSVCIITSWIYLPMVTGYPSGAPQSSCDSMNPRHGGSPQNSDPPVTITASSNSYTPGQVITFDLQWTAGTSGFKGFLVKVKKPTTDVEPYGSLDMDSGSPGQRICEGSTGNLVTHSNANVKTSVQMVWTAPAQPEGDFNVMVTIVESNSNNENIYWDPQNLATITSDLGDPSGPTNPNQPTDPSGDVPDPEFIDLTTCGLEKGCFRNPDDCAGKLCDYILTWQHDSNGFVDYEMSASLQNQQYVAMGLSHDRDMGDDSVTQCIFDETSNVIKIENSFNDGRSNSPLNDPLYGLDESSLSGGFNEGQVTCKFRRYVDPGDSGSNSDDERVFPLDKNYHILMVKGHGSNGIMSPHNPDDSISSSTTVDMTSADYITIGGSVSNYPMVKAHACLMILAWMICASIGVLMPRHAKQLWPGHDIMKLKLWFQIHRGLMITVFVATIASFIIIFIEVGGYSDLSESVDKAHPPMGIVVTILGLSNPIIAIFRCGPEHANRPLFNWIHFLVGTAAHIGGVITIFLGTYMTKAQAPSSTRYILIIFTVIHVITELILIIVTKCINSNATNSIEMSPDMSKKEDKPRYIATIKTAILITYSIVTVSLGLTLIIILASV